MQAPVTRALQLSRRFTVASALHRRSQSPLALIGDLLPRIMALDTPPEILEDFRCKNRKCRAPTEWHVDIDTFLDDENLGFFIHSTNPWKAHVDAVFSIILTLVHPHPLLPSSEPMFHIHGSGGDCKSMRGNYYWPPVPGTQRWGNVEFYRAGPFSILCGVINYTEETFTGSRSQFPAQLLRISMCRA